MLPELRSSGIWNQIGKKIRDHHSVIAVTGAHRPGANGGEVAGGINLINPQNRQSALIGISPATAGSGKGIDEIPGELAMDHIRGRRIEVPAEEGGGVGKIRRLRENLLGEIQLLRAKDAVVAMGLPRRRGPQSEVGGGGAEVDVHDFKSGPGGC